MLKNSAGAYQPTYLSDAAVANAYSRIIGSHQMRTRATQGLLESAGKAGEAVAHGAMREIAEIERNEDRVGTLEYQKALTSKMIDMRTRILSGEVSLESEEALKAWCAGAKDSFADWHEEALKNDKISPAAQRKGSEWKAAMEADVEKFVFSVFSEKFRENRVREKDNALAAFETQEVYNAGPEAFDTAKELALEKGASLDEIEAAAIKGAFLNISAEMQRSIADLRKNGEEKFLLSRVDWLNEALAFVDANADADKDGELSFAEAKNAEVLKKSAQELSTVSASELKDMREKRINDRFAKQRDQLQKEIRDENEHSLNNLRKQVFENSNALTAEDPFVQAYFNGDVEAARFAIAEQWKETEKQYRDTYEVQAKKEQAARNDLACKAYAEILDACLAGNPDRIAELKKVLSIKDGVELEKIIIPDDTAILPGRAIRNGAKTHRVETWELVRIAEAARNAYSEKSPEELAYVVSQLTSGEIALTQSDARLIQSILTGSARVSTAQKVYADKLYRKLNASTFVSSSKEEVAKKQENAMNAYMSALEKFYKFCLDTDLDLENEGSTFRAGIDSTMKELTEAIDKGHSWDRRLELLSSMQRELAIPIAPTFKKNNNDKD